MSGSGRALQSDEWHDFMFRVEGAMAERLEGSFAELWAVTTGEVQVPTVTAPVVRADGAVPFLALSSSPSPGYRHDGKLFLFSLLAAREEILRRNRPISCPNATMRKCDRQGPRRRESLHHPAQRSYRPAIGALGGTAQSMARSLEADMRLYGISRPSPTPKAALVVDGAWSVIGSANTDIQPAAEINRRECDRHPGRAIRTGAGGTIPARSGALERDHGWRNGKSAGRCSEVLEIASQAMVQQY